MSSGSVRPNEFRNATPASTSNDGARKFSSGQLSAVAIIATLLTVFAGWAVVRFLLLPQWVPVNSRSAQDADEGPDGRLLPELRE